MGGGQQDIWLWRETGLDHLKPFMPAQKLGLTLSVTGELLKTWGHSQLGGCCNNLGVSGVRLER